MSTLHKSLAAVVAMAITASVALGVLVSSARLAPALLRMSEDHPLLLQGGTLLFLLLSLSLVFTSRGAEMGQPLNASEFNASMKAQ